MVKRVLVTGAARGIGQATAEHFRQRGWEVVGVDREQGDLATTEGRKRVLALVGTRPLNCLVNNAAILVEKGLLTTSPEELAAVLSTNVMAPFLLMQALAPQLTGGSIVNIASVHARATSTGLAAYAASKGALTALTRAAALELAPIRVNCVLPGAVNTPMLRPGLSLEAIPLRRIAQPEEIAQVVYFLAEADYVTGQEVVCDGGMLARLAAE